MWWEWLGHEIYLGENRKLQGCVVFFLDMTMVYQVTLVEREWESVVLVVMYLVENHIQQTCDPAGWEGQCLAGMAWLVEVAGWVAEAAWPWHIQSVCRTCPPCP